MNLNLFASLLLKFLILLLFTCISGIMFNIGAESLLIRPSIHRYGKFTRRFLNRVLFEEQETQSYPSQGESSPVLKVTLDAGDYRCKHIIDILKLSTGDSLRCGIIDVGMTETAMIEVSPDPTPSPSMRKANKVSGRKSDCVSNGNDPSHTPLVINLGARENLKINDQPAVDLILAVPRPLRLERLIPIISCLGVHRIFLVQAQKVQKDYFGCRLFRRPDLLRELLMEGLQQAEVDCRLPEVLVRRNLRVLMQEELPEIYGRSASSPVTNAVCTNPSEQESHLQVTNSSSNEMTSSLSISKSERDSSISSSKSMSGPVVYKVIAHPPLEEMYPMYSDLLGDDDDDSHDRDHGGGEGTAQSVQDTRTSATRAGSSSRSIRFASYISKVVQEAVTATAQTEALRATESVDLLSSGDRKAVSAAPQPLPPRHPLRRMLVAVGPEGGWAQEEVELFHSCGFDAVHLGSRILRTDIAVPVLLGLAHECLASLDCARPQAASN